MCFKFAFQRVKRRAGLGYENGLGLITVMLFKNSYSTVQLSHKVMRARELHVSHSRVAHKSLTSCTRVAHESFAVNYPFHSRKV